MSVSLSHILGAETVAEKVMISGITADSRKVTEGSLFVAIPGTKYDGRDYIESAIKRGASAILSTPDVVITDDKVTLITDLNPRRRYSNMAARFYRAQPEVQVAITGTNGKTSVADFVRQIWTALNHDASSLGTLGVCSSHINTPGGLTTPDPMSLHRSLAELSGSGVTHCAIEASSHGLDQYRLDGVHFMAAGFTNLSRDHMDYHRTEQGYLFAKARLFGELLRPGAVAVINTDSKSGRIIEDLSWGRGLKTISVGTREDASIRLVKQEGKPNGQRITARYEGSDYHFDVNLFGAFQAENILLAVGLVMATGASFKDIAEVLPHLEGVPGRMEYIGSTQVGGQVYVDYAHTPDGLKNVLQSARSYNPKSLSVVFGCGGDRDIGKRPEMGAIATNLADRVYVTDDNPRSEDAAIIRNQILETCKSAYEIGDRREAIAAAMSNLGSKDMLIIAGKGHEEGQIVGDTVLPFSDLEAVRSILSQTGNPGEGKV